VTGGDGMCVCVWVCVCVSECVKVIERELVKVVTSDDGVCVFRVSEGVSERQRNGGLGRQLVACQSYDWR